MFYKLTLSEFDFLKMHSPESIEMAKIEKIDLEVSLNVSDTSEFELRINDAILDVGMDDEDTVNEIGKQLYRIYDILLYQKKNAL